MREGSEREKNGEGRAARPISRRPAKIRSGGEADGERRRGIYRCTGRRDIATALAAPCSLHYRSRSTIWPTTTPRLPTQPLISLRAFQIYYHPARARARALACSLLLKNLDKDVARSYNADPGAGRPYTVRAVLYDVFGVSDRKWTISATVERTARYARPRRGEKERGRKARAVFNLCCKSRRPLNVHVREILASSWRAKLPLILFFYVLRYLIALVSMHLI